MSTYGFNVTIFIFLFSQIILAPDLFFGVASGVNVFIHGLAFYISFCLTLSFQTFSWFKANKKQTNSLSYGPTPKDFLSPAPAIT